MTQTPPSNPTAPRGVRLVAIIVGALLFLRLDSGFAQLYPTRAVKLVVAQAPGAHNDVIARLFGQALADLWKQPVVVENHGGAGGTIGASLVAKAPADGYTLLIGGENNLALAPILVTNLPYDPIKDFIPIARLARVPYALAVNARIPARSLPELVAYARAHPGALTYGSGGTGSMSSLGAELLKSAENLDIIHIPYRGSAPAVMALVGGQVDMVITDLSLLAQHEKTGALRLLAAAGAKRAPAAPDLPTIAEQGVAGFALDPWYGVVAPAGTPPDVVATLVSALSEVVRKPETRQSLEQLGYEPIVETPAQFAVAIRADIEKYSNLLKRAGIRD
jgi:tripartite-type tricarboxylate transporter receptor subunit TctC